MKTLDIRWQRLVNDEGRTCDRCGSTGEAVRDAVAKLSRSLAPLGVDVVLKEEAISQAEFDRATLESNRIFLDGTPLEEWIGAEEGKSGCSTACGDSDCRTVSVDGATYETIPSDLIVRAGLLAANRVLGAPAPPSPSPCCDPRNKP